MMTVGDRIKIEAKIEVLKDIAIDYRGKTIDNYCCPIKLENSIFTLAHACA